jgi:hypothetical protein
MSSLLSSNCVTFPFLSPLSLNHKRPIYEPIVVRLGGHFVSNYRMISSVSTAIFADETSQLQDSGPLCAGADPADYGAEMLFRF